MQAGKESSRAWLEVGGAVRRWLGSRELTTLLLVAALAGGVWVFVALADAVHEDELRRVDEAVLLAMREPGDHADPLGPRWVEQMGRDVTALGGTTVLTLVTAGVAGYLWLDGKRRALLLLLASVLGGWALSSALKLGFARPRPDLVPHGAYVYTASFPSGHAMMSAVTYLTLAALVSRVVPHRRTKLFVLACALVLTGLTGLSRIYLGVHWPTDVLAGWALGASWACGCWLVADWLAHRGPRRRSGQDAV
jgi:undecaprenyl-diphosphatase